MHMTKDEIIANLKAKAIETFVAELDKATDQLVEALGDEVRGQHVEKIQKTTLGTRIKLAETNEVMSETGMTLDEIKEFNAYSDGYNQRGTQLVEALVTKEVITEAEVESGKPAAENFEGLQNAEKLDAVQILNTDTALTKENVDSMLDAVIGK